VLQFAQVTTVEDGFIKEELIIKEGFIIFKA
jgi:hypothetical protein